MGLEDVYKRQDENGLNLDNWKVDLENATQPSDFDVLLSFIKLHHVVNLSLIHI